MTLPATGTELIIESMGVPLYSARGISQTLAPIEAARQQRRTINGELRDLSVSQMRKYASIVNGQDINPPATDAIWPGRQVTVSCVVELCCPSSAEPERTPVEGSVRVVGDFKFYRPKLIMLVSPAGINLDEWARLHQWSLEFSEK